MKENGKIIEQMGMGNFGMQMVILVGILLYIDEGEWKDD